MALHSHYGLLIDSTLIGGITSQTVREQTEARGVATSGESRIRFRYLVSQKPGFDHTTYAVKAAIDAISTLGRVISNDVSCYSTAITEGSSIASGSSHRKHTARQGLILPRTLSCSHQGDATLTLATIATSDGTNEPVATADSQALPAGLSDTERWTLGAIQVAGKTLTDFTDLEIDFGVNARSVGTQSRIWDTLSWVPTFDPSIRIRGLDPSWITSANIPTGGIAATHANTLIYLYPRTQTGINEAAGIEITMDGLAYADTRHESSGDSESQCAIMIASEYDGTNEPIVLDTAWTSP